MCWLYYDIGKQLRVRDMVSLSYVRCEIFPMFDYLILYNVFNHFAFCTRNWDINEISRVYFTKDEFVAQRALFSKIGHSENVIPHDLTQMLFDDAVFSFDLDIQKIFCAIQSRKNLF